MAGLVWSGEYLFTLPALARASIEASATIGWLIPNDLNLDPRPICARGWIERANDISVSLKSPSTPEIQTSLETTQQALETAIREFYSDDEVKVNKHGAVTSIAGEPYPKLTERVKRIQQIWDHGDNWIKSYSRLCQWTHPNAGSSEMFTADGVYNMPPPLVAQMFLTASQAYLFGLDHIVGFFGWQREPLNRAYDAVGLIESIVAQAWK